MLNVSFTAEKVIIVWFSWPPLSPTPAPRLTGEGARRRYNTCRETQSQCWRSFGIKLEDFKSCRTLQVITGNFLLLPVWRLLFLPPTLPSVIPDQVSVRTKSLLQDSSSVMTVCLDSSAEEESQFAALCCFLSLSCSVAQLQRLVGCKHHSICVKYFHVDPED